MAQARVEYAQGAAGIRSGDATARSQDIGQQTTDQNVRAQDMALRGQDMAVREQDMGQQKVDQSTRGLDLETQRTNIAQQGQDANQAQFRTQTSLAQQQANDAKSAFYEGQRTHLADQGYGGQLARQGAIEGAIGVDQKQQSINNGTEATAEARSDSWVDKGIKAGTTAGGYVFSAVSDRRMKRDIHDGRRDALDFVNALHASDYKYKNPNTPTTSPGRHTSVMVDELEESKLGRRMVHDTPHGKVVDYREGFATALASIAALKDEFADLKAAFAARKGAMAK